MKFSSINFKNLYVVTCIVLVAKLIVLGYFLYNNALLSYFNCNGIALDGNDTRGYIVPILDFMAGNGYGPPCRLPGYLPFVYVLSIFFSSMTIIKNLIVALQILLASLAIAIIINYLHDVIKNRLLLIITAFVLAFNTYTGIWDIFIMADSFASSFAIISVFLLSNMNLSKSKILVSSCLLIWSVFFRSANIIFIPVCAAYLFYLFYPLGLKKNLQYMLIFLLPIITSLGVWTYRNYKVENELIILTTNKNCFTDNPEQYFEMIKIPAALGMDFTWGTDGEYFIDARVKMPAKVIENAVTKEFSVEDILRLRADYLHSLKDSSQVNIVELIDRMSSYRQSYSKTYPWRYYVSNPIKLTAMFLFPYKLDNLILPKRNDMSKFQFGLKAAYLISLWMISLLFILNIFATAYRILLSKSFRPFLFEILVLALPATFIFAHTFLIGYIEQRYLAGAYLMMVINAALFLNYLFTLRDKK